MKVLIKHERSIPNPNKPYEKNGKVLTWDNVNLYCVELDRYGAGPILPNDRNNMIVKIKYEEFEKLTGFTYEEFGELFPSFRSRTESCNLFDADRRCLKN